MKNSSPTEMTFSTLESLMLTTNSLPIDGKAFLMACGMITCTSDCMNDMPMLLHTTIQVPVTNVWLGLDMESFKWVKPYGEGKHADMLLRFNSESENRYYAKWATMDVSFTNNSHAGFYILPKDVYSFMKSAYEADTNMTFHASRTFRMGRVPSEDDLLDKNLYMVFRTRTKLDDEGKLVSAHYGKIYGPWSIWKNTSAQMIFFNAIPNNTNLEDVHTYNESELLEGR